MGYLQKIKFFKRLMDDPELDKLYKVLKERRLDPSFAEVEDALIRYGAFFYHHSLEYGIKNGMKVGKNARVEPFVVFMGFKNIEIGDDFTASGFSTIRAVEEKIIIGNQVFIGPGVSILGANHNYESRDKPIALQGEKSERVIIEDDVWIGANAVVLPGVRIGKGSVVGAGAVVNSDIPEYSVCAGVPAEVIKKR